MSTDPKELLSDLYAAKEALNRVIRALTTRDGAVMTVEIPTAHYVQIIYAAKQLAKYELPSSEGDL